MKNIVLPAILLFFTACSNPLLKWIEMPEEESRTVSMSDKVISSFSFGIEGESVLIRTDSDGDGRTPITVVLPANHDLAALEPQITFIGKSISPRSGEPKDFNSPVVYRVTAEDDSFRDYVVQVYVKNSLANAIIWFDLEIPRAGEHILVAGVVKNPVEGEQGEIIIHSTQRDRSGSPHRSYSTNRCLRPGSEWSTIPGNGDNPDGRFFRSRSLYGIRGNRGDQGVPGYGFDGQGQLQGDTRLFL